MKNKIKIFVIFTLIVTVGFLTVSCSSVEPAPPPVNTSLDGIWSRGDIVITISGSSAIFTEISPDTNWHRVQNIGQISIGDTKFRDITPDGDLRWTAQDLTFNNDSYRISGWQNAIITMDTDGLSIHVSTGGGVSNPENTYLRVR